LNDFFQQGSGVYFISSKNNSIELAQLIMNLADKPLEGFESGKKKSCICRNEFFLEGYGKKAFRFFKYN